MTSAGRGDRRAGVAAGPAALTGLASTVVVTVSTSVGTRFSASPVPTTTATTTATERAPAPQAPGNPQASWDLATSSPSSSGTAPAEG